MTTRSIDRLNILLMIASCILAFVFPFQLFLFSFAVLGPLHYFTEIPWLHGKKYYTGGKYDYVLLLGLACIIAVIHYMTPLGQVQTPDLKMLITIFSFAVFAAALILTTVKKTSQRVIGLIIVAASAVALSQFDVTGLIFASLIPTILHVFLFTGAFILYGALRHKSTLGIASLIVFAICTAAIFLIDPSPTADRSLSHYVQQSYLLFAGLNFDLMNILGLQKTTPTTHGLADILFRSNAGIIIMRLIAFSYTYHFLNWFSKTSIIKWHQIPKRSMAIILLLWVASLALYWYNYEIGLQYLYFASLVHVVLEYPLDHRTFIGIGQELKALVTGKKAVVEPARG
jgi:hypothetical protein